MFRCIGVMGVKGLWGGGCRAGRGVERSRFGTDLEVVYKYRLSLHKAQWMTYAMTDPGFPLCFEQIFRNLKGLLILPGPDKF